jgi:hypothetical protein
MARLMHGPVLSSLGVWSLGQLSDPRLGPVSAADCNPASSPQACRPTPQVGGPMAIALTVTYAAWIVPPLVYDPQGP